MKMLLRLRYVATCDFRRSEATNFKDDRVVPADVRGAMKPGDAVCLKPGSGRQVVFVFRPTWATRSDGQQLEVTSSMRLRLPAHRRWDPLMLADYAAEVGLELQGLKALRDVLAPFGGAA